MTFLKRPGVAIALGLFLWIVLSIVLVPRFPTVFIDEAENANHAFNLAFHHQAVFSLYDNVYPPSLYFMRHAWPVVIRPFFVYPLAFSFLVFGFDFVHARLFNSLIGSLSLLLIYGLGVRLGGRRTGLLAAALLATRFAFMYTTHMIRPEALLCCAGLLSWTCLLKGLDHERLGWLLFGGFLAGAAAGIHTNGLLLGIPFFGILVIERRWRALLPGLLGWGVGFSCFLLSADWTQFIPGLHSLFLQEFTTPPLSKYHFNVFVALNMEIERYYGGWIFSQWRGGDVFRLLLGWQMIVYTTSLCWAATQTREIQRYAWAGGLLGLGYAFAVAQKSYNYTTVLEPYALLPLSAWLTQGVLHRRSAALGAAGVLALWPMGGFPVTAALGLGLLPKRAMQPLVLLLLICAAAYIDSVRSWLFELRGNLAAYGPVMICGMILASALLVFCRPLKSFCLRSAVAGTLGIVTLGTVIFIGGIWSYRPTFLEICNTMAASMTPNTRVAGPQTLWLGLASSYDYRDIGGLTWFHLLLNDNHLLRPLQILHPNYMIVDGLTLHRLQRSDRDPNGPALQGPTGLFPWPHRVIGVMPTGKAYGERLALIENQWPEEARPSSKASNPEARAAHRVKV